jgi:hypothetical protein
MLNVKKFYRYPQALVMVTAVVVIGFVVVYGRAAALIGDINGDGKVDITDLSIMLSDWGTNNAAADLNHDGTVNVFDLSLLLAHWGQTGPTPTPTPTATPTPTPSPSPTAVRSTNCTPADTATMTNNVSHLCGFPDVTNTGVPAGTTLTSSGSISVTTGGAVVDAKNVSGSIEVHASNVTIKRTKVTGGGIYPIRIFPGFSNVTVEDVEVDGDSSCGRSVQPDGSGTLLMLRMNVSGCEDGVQMSDNNTLQDSYIHNLRFSSTSHNDGVQQNGGSSDVVRHNTIFNPHNETSCVNFTTDFGGISNITIDHNLLSGGNYTVYSRSGGNGNPTGVKVTNNHFGRWYVFGLLSADGSVSESGNVWDDTGAAVTP